MSMYSTKSDLKRGHVLTIYLLILLLVISAFFNFKNSQASGFETPAKRVVKEEIFVLPAISSMIAIDTNEWFCANENSKGDCTTWQHDSGLSGEN